MGERARRLQAAEAGADYDDARPVGGQSLLSHLDHLDPC
jgi:hypothetical protein